MTCCLFLQHGNDGDELVDDCKWAKVLTTFRSKLATELADVICQEQLVVSSPLFASVSDLLATLWRCIKLFLAD